MAKLLSSPQFRVPGGASEARRQQVEWKNSCLLYWLMPGIAAEYVSFEQRKRAPVAPFDF
jgi:hypothetical protein